MREILPGIFQIPLTLSGFSPDTVNTYLIRDRDGYTLIDTGWDAPPSIQSFEKQLDEIGATMTDIKRAIITHCHIDHFGMIPRFKKNFGTKIYIHQNEIGLIKTRFNGRDNFLPMTDKFLRSHGTPLVELTPPKFQLPMPSNLASTPPDVLLRGNEEIIVGDYTLKVVNTPGHTPGHICLFEPQNQLIFSGDILLPTIATNAAMHVQHIRHPIHQYLNSLFILKELEIKLILPGHEYVFNDHRKRIAELFNHNQQKADEIRKTFDTGLKQTAYDVASEIFHKQTDAFWGKMTGWDKRFAILQTIAHLESWRFEHVLSQEFNNETFYYRLVN